jgi:hypothetical protein
MAFRFLDLPSEIRILVYKILLADPSIVVQYLFVRNHFRSAFRSKTPPGLSAQILRTCKQIDHEGAPILYGVPEFDCSNCILGVEKLLAQIGNRYFNLIKRIALDAEYLHDVAGALRGEPSGGKYKKLESLTTTAHPLLDITKPGWEFELKLHAMAKLCLSAQQILKSGSLLRVIGQDSRKQNSRSYGDGIDVSNCRVRWRFVRSHADLSQGENVLDIARLLDLALLLQRRSGEAIIMTGGCTAPIPLLHGMQLIMYP